MERHLGNENSSEPFIVYELQNFGMCLVHDQKLSKMLLWVIWKWWKSALHNSKLLTWVIPNQVHSQPRGGEEPSPFTVGAAIRSEWARVWSSFSKAFHLMWCSSKPRQRLFLLGKTNDQVVPWNSPTQDEHLKWVAGPVVLSHAAAL